MTTLPRRTWVRNAAAVFSGRHGDVTRQAKPVGCSRQAVSDQARQIGHRLPPPAPPDPPAEGPIPAPAALFDPATQRRLAVVALAMGISTRQIEDRLRGILPEEGPDHSTIGRRVADQARTARPILEALDAACPPEVRTLAVDEIFLGGDRPSSASSQRA